jgi:hypothetical protein
MDHPGSVRRLCLMEAIPIGEALARCDARFAASWYHWFFFGQTERPAERFISADPGAWYTATAEHMGSEAYEDYRRAIHNPATVHAMMEDYRADSASTGSTTRPTAPRAGGSGLRCCSCGRPGTTSKISTVTRSPSGATGPREGGWSGSRTRARRRAAWALALLHKAAA